MALRLPVVLSHQASYCGRGTSRTAGDCKTFWRSEEHTSLQSQSNLVCRLLLEKKKKESSHLAKCGSYINRRNNPGPLAWPRSNRHGPEVGFLDRFVGLDALRHVAFHELYIYQA